MAPRKPPRPSRRMAVVQCYRDDGALVFAQAVWVEGDVDAVNGLLGLALATPHGALVTAAWESDGPTLRPVA